MNDDWRRFIEKVSIPERGGCWIWTGSRNEIGYGSFRFESSTRLAHRVMFVFLNGEVDPNLLVLHRCDNPPCVNPAHLFLGTQTDNMRDMSAKGRNASTRYPERLSARALAFAAAHPEKVLRGEQIGNSKMTAERVRALREKRQAGVSIESLASEFGISIAQVSRIANGKRWAHVS